ncbi:MAG: hypothetical protein Q8O46_01915 [bacterium]|nr:hypothetical protein [bacterium]
MSPRAENINRSIAPMPKEGTITGNIKMITKINDYCLGQPNMMFLTRTLTSENYTIYITGNNVTYFTKPDANGDFSINVLYGTYNIWVLVDGPYGISYPGLCEYYI